MYASFFFAFLNEKTEIIGKAVVSAYKNLGGYYA